MLEEKKEILVKIAKDAESSGLCKPGSGNFSIRDVESGYIVITPSQIGRKDLTPDHILVVDIEGNIIENIKNVKPTSETLMHLNVYKARQDVNGVVHTHSKYATAFAIQGIPLEPVVFEALTYGQTAPVAPYQCPGTIELAQSIVPFLKDHNAVLLEKHGVIVVDPDINNAYANAQYLEEVAEMTFIATVIGNGVLPSRINQAEFDKFLCKK